MWCNAWQLDAPSNATPCDRRSQSSSTDECQADSSPKTLLALPLRRRRLIFSARNGKGSDRRVCAAHMYAVVTARADTWQAMCVRVMRGNRQTQQVLTRANSVRKVYPISAAGRSAMSDHPLPLGRRTRWNPASQNTAGVLSSSSPFDTAVCVHIERKTPATCCSNASQSIARVILASIEREV